MKFLSVVSDLVAAGFEIPKIISQDGKTFSDENHSEEQWLKYTQFLSVGFWKREKLWTCRERKYRKKEIEKDRKINEYFIT